MNIKEIENAFQAYYGKTISSLVAQHVQYAGYTNTAVINIQDSLITRKIKASNPHFDKSQMSDYQKGEYAQALIEQLFYVLTQGDFDMLAGYDLTTNTVINISELDGRSLWRGAKDRLEAAGLLYRGLNREMYHPRRGWN